MKSDGISRFLHWTLLSFVVLFMGTLPYHYFLFPSVGLLLRDVITEIVGFFFTPDGTGYFSDSAVMYQWLGIVAFTSIVLGGIFTWRLGTSLERLRFWLIRVSIYILALMLLTYGFNKVFCYQFTLPEPNILNTPLGQLSVDFRYWTAMGSSPFYVRFMGIIEVVPGLLLFFPRTRFLGSLIAFGVLVNVCAVNFGFGITVKIQSAFLLFFSVIALWAYRDRLKMMVGLAQENLKDQTGIAPKGEWYEKSYRLAKPLFIGLILYESLGMYFSTGVFDGNSTYKPDEYGTYLLEPNEEGLQRVFFHSHGYFITQDSQDVFTDYAYTLREDRLTLFGDAGESAVLLFEEDTHGYHFQGDFFGRVVRWHAVKEVIE